MPTIPQDHLLLLLLLLKALLNLHLLHIPDMEKRFLYQTHSLERRNNIFFSLLILIDAKIQKLKLLFYARRLSTAADTSTPSTGYNFILFFFLMNSGKWLHFSTVSQDNLNNGFPKIAPFIRKNVFSVRWKFSREIII